MEMVETDNQPFAISPRQILANIVEQVKSLDLYPTVAVELEFYLLDKKLDHLGQPQAPINPTNNRRDDRTQVYSMDDLDAYSAFINRVQNYCKQQNIPADKAVAEYAPGQFEINLEHCNDPVLACDQAIMLKRLIKNTAREMSFQATFMAKPFASISWLRYTYSCQLL